VGAIEDTREVADPTVLVVGAAPPGLMLAGELARLGVTARLVERDREPHREARATAIQSRTLDILDRLGIVDGWLQEGLALGTFRLRSRSGEELRAERFEDLDVPYPFVLNLQQRITERLLEEHLVRQGGRVERGVELIALEQDSRGVDVELRDAEGGVEAARFAYVVGADGVHSRVRDALLVPLAGGDYASVFAAAEIEATFPYPTTEVTIFAVPSGILFFAPFADGRLILVANDPAGSDQAPSRDELRDLVTERGPAGIEIREVVWSARFHIHCRLAERFRIGRVFLAGDSAHVCSPFGGQGLNMGLHDAWNLGWKLALVAHGQAPEALLSSYQPERRRIAQCELAFSDATHRAALTRDVAWPASALAHEAAFLGASDNAARRRLLAHAELDVTYRRSPIVESRGRSRSGALRAGDWFPERLSPDRHHVLAPPGTELDGALGGLRVPTQLHVREGEDRLLLVRPDGYVGFVSRPADPSALAEYLHRVFGAEAAGVAPETGS
jgi:2-polyprenyl-6-methoxyphenol hydroxylase-like FAD-dependent oxidoreductase